jgi:hypothetical protein
MNSDKNTVIGIVVVAIGALALLCACLCCCGTATVWSVYWIADQAEGTPEPTPDPMDFRGVPLPGSPEARLVQALADQVASTSTTDTDYWVLFGQLESETGEPAVREPVQEPTEYEEGDVHTFWMSDEEAQRYWQVDAELEIKTEHTYVYVSEGLSYDADKLRQAVDIFESQIYPTNHRYFGTEWTPGIDNDPHMTILVTDQMPFGIAGYFSSVDEYPAVMKPRSNQREMIYVTSGYLNNAENFGQLLSHEFQHMIHWNQDISEALWINEGLSLLAEEVNGYGSVLGSFDFWSDPDIQLTNWAEERGDRLRNYAASKLFLSYLSEHYGGYETLSRLAADDADGTEGVERALRSGGYDVDFETVFADWVVANIVNDASVGDGQYRYALRGSREPRFSATLAQGGDEYVGWVRQFGADYVEIEPQSGRTVAFEGSGLARLTATDPFGGDFAWWSNRRNMLSSSLTRQVDLDDVDTATLRFRTWYDIEDDFDYGYVMVSTDEGRTWETVPGTHTTADDPNNSNLGYGYTGKSGGWLAEEVDLSAYAGQQILLRFWYITDPGLNQSGWLIDDIAIPEVGFSDGAEQEGGGWMVDGFIRSSNDLAQAYIVRLVEYAPQGKIAVRQLELDADNAVEVELDAATERAVLVVAGATHWTSELAPYRVTLQP